MSDGADGYQLRDLLGLESQVEFDLESHHELDVSDRIPALDRPGRVFIGDRVGAGAEDRPEQLLESRVNSHVRVSNLQVHRSQTNLERWPTNGRKNKATPAFCGRPPPPIRAEAHRPTLRPEATGTRLSTGHHRASHYPTTRPSERWTQAETAGVQPFRRSGRAGTHSRSQALPATQDVTRAGHRPAAPMQQPETGRAHDRALPGLVIPERAVVRWHLSCSWTRGRGICAAATEARDERFRAPEAQGDGITRETRAVARPDDMGRAPSLRT